MIMYELWVENILEDRDTLSDAAARDAIEQVIRRIVPSEADATKQFYECMMCLASGRGVEIQHPKANNKFVFKPKTKANQEATLKLIDGGKS